MVSRLSVSLVTIREPVPTYSQLISLNGENRMETQIFVPHNPQEAANIQALADYLSSIYYGN